MRLNLILIMVLATMFSFRALAEELRISAGVSAVSAIFSKIQQPFEAKTGIKLMWTNKDPKGQGGDAVFKEVDQGIAEAGAAGTTWPDWVSMLEEKKYTAKHTDDMKHKVIGNDLFQFYTYLGGPKKLSEEQIAGLFTGKLKNWKEVGGEDKPVVILVSAKQPAGENFLVQHHFNKIPIPNKTVVPGEIFDYVKKVGATPGAIGFGPSDLNGDYVNSPQHPSIGRPVTMMWVGTPSKSLNSFMDFIAKEGKKYGVRN